MINGVHAIIYARHAAATRRFFRDVLRWAHVDAGDGWLIFALPPAELGVHPVQPGPPGATRHELFLMCDDVHRTVAALKAKGVNVRGPVVDRGWGLLTTLRLPGGAGEIGLYQPRHASPTRRSARKARRPASTRAASRAPTRRSGGRAAKPR
jgi:predicted enzyme related to lactoylglutathione lyase